MLKLNFKMNLQFHRNAEYGCDAYLLWSKSPLKALRGKKVRNIVRKNNMLSKYKNIPSLEL